MTLAETVMAPPDGHVAGAVCFLFGTEPLGDPEASTRLADEVVDQAAPLLIDAGLTVLRHAHAHHDDLTRFVARERDDDLTPVGLVWIGAPGPGASLLTADGRTVTPADLDEIRIADSLRFVLLSSCDTGVEAARWHRALDDGPTIVGWRGITRLAVPAGYRDGDRAREEYRRILRTYLLNPALEPVGRS